MKKSILLVILALIVLGAFFIFLVISTENLSSFQIKFAGVILNFRANLTEAENISVYPDEKTLRDIILNDNVKEIGVAYIPNETENSYYLAASYELAYKLTIINRHYFNKVKTIDSIPLNSSSDAFDMASEIKPIILLLGPTKANITSVEIYPQGYVIMAKGESFQEVNRNYTDLDLAVDKILLVLMKNPTEN